MNPEKEIELCETVSRIEANLSNCVSKLEDHTKADSDNFEKLSDKMDVLIGEDNKRLGAAKTKSFLWSAFTSGGLIAGFEFAKSLWFK